MLRKNAYILSKKKAGVTTFSPPIISVRNLQGFGNLQSFVRNLQSFVRNLQSFVRNLQGFGNLEGFALY